MLFFAVLIVLKYKKHYVNNDSVNDQDIFLKNFSNQIQSKRHVEFAKELLKVVDLKKCMRFFIIMENISKLAELLPEPAHYPLMFQKEEKSLTTQLISINIKIFMIFLQVTL